MTGADEGEDPEFEDVVAFVRERAPEELSRSEVNDLLDVLRDKGFISQLGLESARRMLQEGKAPAHVVGWVARRKARPTG